MNPVVLGYIRHALTVVGGYLVSKGYTDSSTSEALIGGVIALIGVIASHLKNKKS